MRGLYLFVPLTLVLPVLGCGGSSADAIGLPDGIGPTTGVPCTRTSECEDGAVCNGQEVCFEGFCHEGVSPNCDDGLDCTRDECSHVENRCLFVPPDEDGDGHADAACEGSDGSPLGDDCDDSDPTRFPGNDEICAEDDPEHDEDCEPGTFGTRDEDGDGVTSDACCNVGVNGRRRCGGDCDDSDVRINPDHPEICDDLDNDCDGKTDNDTQEVLWFPDEDADYFGEIGSEGKLSCSPLAGRALRANDCDDSNAAVQPAAREVCDGIDNNCDGEVDEGGVCSCVPEGNVQACACSPLKTGVQECVGGVWSSCDCAECVSGTTECLGNLLPRHCELGQWVVDDACTGLRPICLDGACVCADGGQDCEEVPDRVPPRLVDLFPAAGARTIARESNLAAVFSEFIASGSVGVENVTLRDGLGNLVPGEVVVGGVSLGFQPDEPLAPGMMYEFAIGEGIEDLAGNELGMAHSVQFSTELAVEPFSVEAPLHIGYSFAELGFSPAGRARMIVEEVLVVSGADILFSTQRWPELQLEDGVWSETAEFETLEPTHFSPLAIDPEERAELLITDAGSVTDHWSRASTQEWDALESPLSSEDLTFVRPLIVANQLGEMVAVGFDTQAEMTRLRTRDATGGWRSVPFGFALSAGAPTSSRGDVSESGYGAVAVAGAAGLNVLRSGPGLDSWVSQSVLTDPVHDADVAVAEDGSATVTWTATAVHILFSYDRIVTQDMDAAGNWLGSPVLVASDPIVLGERSPRVGIDADGTRHVAFVKEHLKAARRLADEEDWSVEEILSVSFDPLIHDVQLRVAENGDAVLVWTQGAAERDLWGVRFTSDDGWGLPRLLEDSNESVLEFDVEMSTTGSAIVVFIDDLENGAASGRLRWTSL